MQAGKSFAAASASTCCLQLLQSGKCCDAARPKWRVVYFIGTSWRTQPVEISILSYGDRRTAGCQAGRGCSSIAAANSSARLAGHQLAGLTALAENALSKRLLRGTGQAQRQQIEAGLHGTSKISLSKSRSGSSQRNPQRLAGQPLHSRFLNATLVLRNDSLKTQKISEDAQRISKEEALRSSSRQSDPLRRAASCAVHPLGCMMSQTYQQIWPRRLGRSPTKSIRSSELNVLQSFWKMFKFVRVSCER